ncbi:MAG: 50S ribosomal protein L31 [Rickettsiales bacterium]|jgi:large subunit ribosomal protein L31|nr:50S ribosomal protein L31 [Rickettsiales bacterium]
MAIKEINELDYHSVKVKMTDGKIFETRSCYGKAGDTIVLDVDPLNHPAWRTDNSSFVNTNDDQITKFKKKFSDFKF